MIKKIINKVDKLSKIMKLYDKNLLKNLKNAFDKALGTGINLTNNEARYIMKVIKSLENRDILIKGTTRKITGQKGGFLNFLRPLMTAGLPLMKSVKMFCYRLHYQQECQQQMQLFKRKFMDQKYITNNFK